MDASDDASVDAEGPLDPRIQIELENLNNCTDEINKLEIELDEAHTAFRQLLSDSTRRLKEIANKIGTGCIEKARCYYKALEVAQQAQIQCQRQAQLFQRASEIHSAAKETVTLAEAGFISHRHEWNFDQAWQDMLNHATIKVMDAENQKAECGREHLRRATLFHDAEKKVQQLEEKHRRAIIKSKPYFEIRAQCDEMLATQKARVECLQKGVKKAKDTYARSLRILEDISNQIHQRRRDYDMTKGPREPGVGAELISPTASLSYEAELDKLSLSRINSLASSEPDIDERTRDFEDVDDLKQRMEQLSTRSVDGSESNSSQWELELQASVERLNTLPIRKLNSFTTDEVSKDFGDFKFSESGLVSDDNCCQISPQVQRSRNNYDNESRISFNHGLTTVKRPLERTDSAICYKDWHSMAEQTTNSSSISSETPSKTQNTLSASLNNDVESENCPISRQEGTADNVEKRDGPSGMDSQNINLTYAKKKISVDLSNLEIDDITESNFENLLNSQSDENVVRSLGLRKEKCNSKNDCEEMFHFSKCDGTHSKLKNNVHQLNENRISNDKSKLGYNSSSSTPVKRRLTSKLEIAKSCENSLNRDFVECPRTKRPSSKTSSVRELPLLSLIQRFPETQFSRDKSCSLTNLAENHSFTTFPGGSNF
ncbi:uncharacterized protein LOC124297491 [Neodiprion virginianus]|uniref:uncharacterized protein LOC124297491 n=1 Tax=Neodiprion virginianus TaxID=2961670 RepID=UPI001EE6E653|nr:uncharacterized protein LOC124297491 [Neodiprion virginianus]